MLSDSFPVARINSVVHRKQKKRTQSCQPLPEFSDTVLYE